MSKKYTTSEQLARFKVQHERTHALRRREDASWTQLEKARDALTQAAAQEWRPDLTWAWGSGHSAGYMTRLTGDVELYVDVCGETGQFHVEFAFQHAVSSHKPGRTYRRANETRILVMGAGLGATVDEAAAVALANFNEARTTAVPDAAALFDAALFKDTQPEETVP